MFLYIKFKDMNFKIKKSKLWFFALGSSLTIIPVFSVISCGKSNSLEARLEQLLSDENIVNLELEINPEKQMSIKDIFTSDASFVKIIESQKIKDWNNNLSEENKEAFFISPKIKTFILPKVDKNNNLEENKNIEINEIEIIVEIATGHLIKGKTITKKIDLTKYKNIDRTIIWGINNYFDVNDEKPGNNLWNGLKNTLIPFLKERNIEISDNNDTLINKFSFNFFDSNKNFYQKNLWCSFDSKNGDMIQLIIYTSDKKIETNENIKNESIAIKMIFNINDIVELI